MKKTAFFVCAVCAQLFFSLLFFSCASLPAVSVAPAADDGEDTVVTLTSQDVSLKRETSDASVSMCYPVYESNKELSTAVSDYCVSHYNRFMDMVSDGEYDPWSTSSEFDLTYTQCDDGKFLCVLIQLYEYDGGAAHGNTLLKSFVWSYADKAFVNASQASGLTFEALSKRCREYLLSNLQSPDEDWIDSGTMPNENCLGVFSIYNSLLTIYFNSYSVAPYSSGIPEVEIHL